MSKKIKKKFHFGLEHIIRLVIFSVAIFFAINYLTSSPGPKLYPEDVLGDSTEIPESINGIIKNISENPKYKQAYTFIENQSRDFPQKQIKEIKLGVINSIYQDMVKSVEKK